MVSHTLPNPILFFNSSLQILIVFMNIRMCGKYQLGFVRSTMPFADKQNLFAICLNQILIKNLPLF
jgi:hypothetical protein